MCKPQGRCGKDHFAAESGGRNRTAARKKVCIIDADPQANTMMAAFGEEMASLPLMSCSRVCCRKSCRTDPGAEALTWLDRVDVPASLTGGHGSDHEHHPGGNFFQGNNKRPERSMTIF